MTSPRLPVQELGLERGGHHRETLETRFGTAGVRFIGGSSTPEQSQRTETPLCKDVIPTGLTSVAPPVSTNVSARVSGIIP